MDRQAEPQTTSEKRVQPSRLPALFEDMLKLPRVIWYSSIASFFGFVSFFLLLSALPIYFEQLGYNAVQIGLIVGSTYALNFLAYFLTALVADRWSSRAYTQLAAVALALSPFLFEATHLLGLLIFASIWQGLTMSAFTTSITAYVGQQAPEEQRGKVIGFYGVLSNLAQAAAPPVGILVGGRLGFPLLFALAAASAIVAALLIFLVPGGRVTHTSFQLRTWLSGIQRVARPGLVQFVVGICRGITIAFLPLYMARGGVTNPALFFTWQIIAIVALRPLSGALSDRYGRMAVIVPGLVCAALGIAILAWQASYLTLALSGIIFGVAVSVLVPAILAWIFDVTSKEQRGLASGIYNTVYDLGRAGSAFGFGFIIALSGYPTMFLLVSIIPLITIVVLLVWPRSSITARVSKEQ